jgi:hypothetical protein
MNGISILILVSLLIWSWIAYEVWRAPYMKENEDGTYTTIRPEKKFRDLFRKSK